MLHAKRISNLVILVTLLSQLVYCDSDDYVEVEVGDTAYFECDGLKEYFDNLKWHKIISVIVFI